MVALAITALFLLAGTAHAVFEVETGGVKVVHPTTDSPRFDMALANFGKALYGAQLVAQLVYPNPSDQYGPWKHECTPAGCNYACAPFSEAKPPFKIVREPGKRYILLLDRGPKDAALQRPCYFLDKVYHAQLAGADAVLVANDHAGDLSTAVAPKDEDSTSELKQLSISAGLISQASGDKLKALLKKGPVTVALNWTDVLPRRQTVAWEFWTNSNDECGTTCDVQRKFIKEFKSAGMLLDQRGHTAFTPHYLIWVCQTASETPEECASQCIRGGKYCCPDPDEDIHKGYSGKDVLMMNLRSLCMHRVAAAHDKAWLWWQYVDKLGDSCAMAQQKYTPDCATDVYKQVVGDQLGAEALAEWQACWRLDDAPDSTDPIPLLEEELKVQTGNDSESTVAMLPTVRVNQRQYRGSLDAASVLRAVCASFPVGSEPTVCNEKWVSDNECLTGSEGDLACNSGANAQAGRTRCINTFAGAGYKCVCGEGYIKVTDKATGSESCADINECLLSSVPWSDPKCKCDRCTCVNSVGGFKCTGPLTNMCTEENNWGGCWHAKERGGEVVHACYDNIHEYRSLAAFGRLNESVATWRCQCPPCWKPTGPNNGGCERVCDSAQCDKLRGVCISNAPAGGARRGGSGGLTILLGTTLSITATMAAVYGAYQLHIRRRMEADMRTILEEYVPLNSAPSNDGSPMSQGLFSAASTDPSEERFFASARSSARTSSSAGDATDAFLVPLPAARRSVP